MEALITVDVTGSDDAIITTLPEGAHYIISSLGEADNGKYYTLRRYDISRKRMHSIDQVAHWKKGTLKINPYFIILKTQDLTEERLNGMRYLA